MQWWTQRPWQTTAGWGLPCYHHRFTITFSCCTLATVLPWQPWKQRRFPSTQSHWNSVCQSKSSSLYLSVSAFSLVIGWIPSSNDNVALRSMSCWRETDGAVTFTTEYLDIITDMKIHVHNDVSFASRLPSVTNEWDAHFCASFFVNIICNFV